MAPRGESGSNGADPGGATPRSADTLRVLDVDRMLVEPPPPVQWLAEPLLVHGAVTLLAGREGTGKSLLALGLAAAIGRGDEIAGIACSSGRVLYVDAENGEAEAHRRLHGLRVRQGTLVYVEADGFNLRKQTDELGRLMLDHHPQVIVLDSLRSLSPGLDENDSAQAEAALRPLVRLAQTHDTAVLVLHHAGKTGNEYRGSTAIGAAVGLGFTLARHPDDPDQRTRRRLACWKCRPAPEPPIRWLRLGADASGGIMLGHAEPFEPTAERREVDAEQLLGTLGTGQPTWAAWARTAGLDSKNGTARRARDRLVESGRVVRDEDGGYRRASG